MLHNLVSLQNRILVDFDDVIQNRNCSLSFQVVCQDRDCNDMIVKSGV